MWLILIAVIVGVALVFALWWFSADQVARRAMRKVPMRVIRDVLEGEKARIVGEAAGDAPIPAPLSGRSCFYWRVTVEEYRRRGKHGSWRTIIDEQEGVDFVVKDGTGKAWIRASHVHSLLEKDARFASGILNDAGPELEAFLARHGHSSEGLLFNKNMRYREGVVEPGEAVAVVGIGRWAQDPDEPAQAAAGYRDMVTPKRLVMEPPEDGPLLLSDESKMKH